MKSLNLFVRPSGPMKVGDCTSSVLYLWLVMLVFSGSVMLQGCSSSEDGLLSQHGTSHWVFLHIKDTDQFFLPESEISKLGS